MATIIYPEYYDAFRCIADRCPDSCCHQWEVDVDPEAAAFYRQLPGALGDRLRSVLRDTESGACMALEDGRCPMWRRDGLCQIQAQLGHEALCETCRTFPRLRHDYGSFVELGLELSCPEAARLILSGEGAALLHDQQPGEAVADYDEEVMSTLLESRNVALRLLEDPACPLPQALAMVLLYAYDVQDQLDGGPVAQPDFPAGLAQLEHCRGSGSVQAFLDFFLQLELLTPQWSSRLKAPQPAPWQPQLRHLARYLVQRYWLQSISDLDLYCRAKLVVIGCVLVRLLGGDPVQTAQLFSKEIENDPDNLEAILSGAYSAPALTDLQLLGLLTQ